MTLLLLFQIFFIVSIDISQLIWPVTLSDKFACIYSVVHRCTDVLELTFQQVPYIDRVGAVTCSLFSQRHRSLTLEQAKEDICSRLAQ